MMMLLRTNQALLLLLVSYIPYARSAVVVSIGDSYAAGDGANALKKNYDDPFCYIEDDTSPGGKYAFTRGLEHIVAACSGDTADATLAQWNDLQLRYLDEAADLWKGSVIIVATGANSLKSRRGEEFETGLVRCLALPGCHEDEDNQIGNFDEVLSDLLVLYSQLAVDAGEATIRIIGYPKIFSSNRFRCSIPGISVHEANFFDSLVVSLNERIAAAVETVKATFPDVDIRFVDVTKYYTNGACSPFNKFRQVRNINTLFPGSSFHPTQRGYDKSYAAFLDTVIV